MKHILITFIDEGQDFLTFEVEKESGQIVEVLPFQGGIWSKHKVVNLKELIETNGIGVAVQLDDPDGLILKELGEEKFFLRHSVEKIEELEIVYLKLKTSGNPEIVINSIKREFNFCKFKVIDIDRERSIGKQAFGEEMRKRYNKTAETFYKQFANNVFYENKEGVKTGLDIQTLWWFRVNEMIESDRVYNQALDDIVAKIKESEEGIHYKTMDKKEIREMIESFKK